MFPQLIQHVRFMLLCMTLSSCRAVVNYVEQEPLPDAPACPEGTSPQEDKCVPISPAMSDAAPLPIDAASEESCDEIFGGVVDYELCQQDEFSCTFAVRTFQSSCSELCAVYDSTCLAAFDNITIPCEAILESGDTCSTRRGSEICVCSR